MPKNPPYTNSHDRMSDCPVAALRFAHGHFDFRLPALPVQPESTELEMLFAKVGMSP